MVTLPVWCACGNIVTFSNESRCEACYADDQQRFSGRSQHIDFPHLSAAQEAANERRAAEIKRVFRGANGR